MAKKEKTTDQIDFDGPVHVLSVRVRNYQAVHWVELTLDDAVPTNPIVIAGPNGAGKSSVLDAVQAIFEGADALSDEAVRFGQEKADIEVRLTNMRCHREVLPDGRSKLVVRSPQGQRMPSPQAIVDRIRGRLGFDLQEFAGLKGDELYNTLLPLVQIPIDLNALAEERKAYFDSRTKINEKKRDFEGELKNHPEPDTKLPKLPIDVDVLVAEKSQMEEVKRSNDKAREGLSAKVRHRNSHQNHAARVAEEIKRAEQNLLDLRAQHQSHQTEADATASLINIESLAIEKLVDPDTTDIDRKITEASETNVKIERAKIWRQMAARLEQLESASGDLTMKIEDCNRRKIEAMAAAKFPIAGLSFDEDRNVRYNGVLFQQIGSANQIRVALAIAMAINPTLREVFIRDASLLDQDTRAIIVSMCNERGYRPWFEIVGKDHPDATIEIVDGVVPGQELELFADAELAELDDDGGTE